MTAAFILTALLASPTAQPARPADVVALERSRAAVIRAAVAAVADVVVTIETVGGAQPLVEPPPAAPPREGRRRRPAAGPREESFRLADGPTTGVIVDPAGLILTSSINFARDPSIITVTLADGRRFVARLVSRDLIRRLALLRIDAADLPVVSWADADALCVGQYAVACGRGLGGDTPSVSLGIISALRRRNGNAVQTDAKTSPVNYGGPLIDLEGRVIGVIVPMAGAGEALAGAEWYDSGIAFAVTKDRIDRVYDRLAAGRDIEPGKIGVVLGTDEPSAIPLLDAILPSTPGVVVTRVAPVSPAAAAGLREGDKITALDQQPVSDLPEFQRRLSDRAAGETITLTIKRRWRTFDVEITLARPTDVRFDPGPPGDASDREHPDEHAPPATTR